MWSQLFYRTKGTIPCFSIRIRMHISIRIRKISIRTPNSMFQLPSKVSACFYLALNSANIIVCLFLPYFKQCLHNIVIIHMKIQHLLSKIWWQVKFFIIYTCPIARIQCISGWLWIWYIMRDKCDLANLTQNNNLNIFCVMILLNAVCKSTASG